MSSIKKVLCLKVKDTCPKERLFTPGIPYDVVAESMLLFAHGDGFLVNDNFGRPTTIIIGDGANCIYGEWQPLEEYVCMTNGYRPLVKKGDILLGYVSNGVLECPSHNRVFGCLNSQFKKVSEIKSTYDIVNTELKPRHEVRHVVYDTKDNKIVNDAMGECYITLAEAQELCDEMNAPKVMKTKYTKEVEYFGMKLLVPDDAKWLSATESGGVIAHTCIIKPARINSCGFYIGTESYKDHYVTGGIDLNGIDWKDTLMEIK